jgi:hypothetical protein
MEPLLFSNQPGWPRGEGRVGWVDIVVVALLGYGGFTLAGVGLRAVGLSGAWATLALGALSLTFLGVLPLLYGRWRRALGAEALGLGRWRWWYLALALAVAAGLLPVRMAIGLLVLAIDGQGLTDLQPRMDMIFPDLTWGAFFSSFLTVALIAPLAEEIFFRGVLYTWLRSELPFWAAVLVNTLFFALAHADSAAVIATSAVMALALCAVYEWTGSIWAAILIHFVNNAAAVILLFAAQAALQALS